MAFNFPRAWLEKSWNFSFSGLKTAVMREVRKLEAKGGPLPTPDLAASFQAAVVDVLVSKTMRAAKEHSVKGVVIAGGVSANRALRQSFQLRNPSSLFIPPLSLCTDNAAMVAGAGYYRFIHGQRDPMDLDASPNWPLSEE